MAEHVVLPCDDQKPYESSPSLVGRLSTFLATYTTPLYYSQPESDDELFVFWSHIDRPRNNPSSYYRGLFFHSPNPREIRHTIKSAFLELKRHSLDVLIQFWSPLETGSITTYDQPFALKNVDSNSQKHRLCSLKYQYNVDANKVEVEEGNPLIINGAPANAFLNHMAEVVLDLRVHQGSPLVRSALECGFMSYFVMPICHPSDQRSCVGVVECCAKNYDDVLEIFMGLPSALQAVGLSTFHGQEYLPYKTIGGLKHAMDETEVALRKVCESYDLSLAQVSIVYGDGNLVPSSLSLENKHMKPMLALKLFAPYIDEDDEGKLVFIDHCGSCDMVPLSIGKEHVRNTLESYQPRFCKNIYGMTNIDQLPATNTITKLSCFVICLRSIDTDNLDYVFEFLWPRYRNHLTMIESLMSTLKIRLPNFKFGSAAQLGDELRVFDCGDVHVCVPKLKRMRHLVYWPGPKHVKRKTNTHKDQGDNGRAVIVPWLDVNPLYPDTLDIKAVYQDKIYKLRFPPSLIPTFEAVEEELAKRFKYIRGNFELTYRDEKGKTNCLVSDEDVRDCLKSATTALARIYVQKIVHID